jgi:thiosulfate reductase/polysulfide reductase chain A
VDKVVRSICQGCHCQCGVLVHLEGGRVSRITGDPHHPMNRGFICVKGQAQAELLYHPDRLKHPLRRLGGRGEGRWQRLSWDEALDDVARRLGEVRCRYGAESLAVITGTGPRTGNNVANLFALMLGTPNKISPLGGGRDEHLRRDYHHDGGRPGL